MVRWRRQNQPHDIVQIASAQGSVRDDRQDPAAARQAHRAGVPAVKRKTANQERAAIVAYLRSLAHRYVLLADKFAVGRRYAEAADAVRAMIAVREAAAMVEARARTDAHRRGG
jgi:hypothetical protein